jgi:hypothetical protein
LAKLIVEKHTLGKMYICKKGKKELTNGESLNQTQCYCYEKKIYQTYNVIFIWEKRLNLNPKPNSKPNPKPFCTMY